MGSYLAALSGSAKAFPSDVIATPDRRVGANLLFDQVVLVEPYNGDALLQRRVRESTARAEREHMRPFGIGTSDQVLDIQREMFTGDSFRSQLVPGTKV